MRRATSRSALLAPAPVSGSLLIPALVALFAALPLGPTDLRADVIGDRELGTLQPGPAGNTAYRSSGLDPEYPQGTLTVQLSEQPNQVFRLLVEGTGPRQSDLGLRVGDQTFDQDLQGDYRRESVLLQGGRTHTVQIFQINQSPADIKLRMRLERLEPQGLVRDQPRGASVDAQQPSAFFVFDHPAPGPLTLTLESDAESRTELTAVLLQPDGHIVLRDEDEDRDPHNEIVLLPEAPAGRYYVEIRRRVLWSRRQTGQAGFRVSYHNRLLEVESNLRVAEMEGQEPTEDPGEADEESGHLRSIAHVVPGEDFLPGRKIQGRLDRRNPRTFHRVNVEAERPLLIDVRAELGDLMLIVRGPFEYRADFDAGKEPGREIVVLPFAGEYQILVQSSDPEEDRTIPYTVRTAVLNPRELKAGQSEEQNIGLHEPGLYRFTVGYNFPVLVNVRGRKPADLFLTIFARKSDGSIEVRNQDADENGRTGDELVRITSSGEFYIMVRQGSGRLRNISFEIQLDENPVLSAP